MKSNENTNIQNRWTCQIIKIFPIIFLFYLFRNNKLIILGLILGLIVLLIRNNLELFGNIQTVEPEQIIKQLNSKDIIRDITKLNYDHLKIDNQAWAVTKIALKDKNLRNLIEKKSLWVYEKIGSNDELKTYLKFMNLIRDDGMPIFINESEEVLLNNKIKILLVI